MVAYHGTIWFLRNFKPLSALYFDLHFSNGKKTVKFVHSLSQFTQKRPINRYVKKTRKSTDKENVVEPKVYTWETIRNISNILRYSTWDSAQEQLENLRIKWDSYTINQVLKTHPPMEKAWLFFNWTSGIRGFKHDQFTYTTLLDIFGEARRISSMKYVFQKMQEQGIKIDVVTYTSLLHWISNDGDVDGSVKLWEEMKANGCSPTVVSYTAYMKILFNHNRVKEATKIYKEMIESGCTPNCYTYTVLMEHLASTGKFNEMLEIFSKMQDAGVQPDKASCNILVEKCCRVGETWAMMRILQYMKENSLVLRKPVYMEALTALRIAGEDDVVLKQANRHFSIQCRDEELTDSLITAADNSIDRGLIVNFLGRKNFAAVDCLLANLMEKNTGLDSQIISAVMESYSAHSKPDGALLAFDYSIKTGIKVEKTAYLSLIGLFIRTNSFPKVLEIIREMVQGGISLGTNLCALLIYRLGCARKSVSASKVFDLLPDEEKSTSAYTALMAAYFASRKVHKGLEVFETMRTKGIPVALGTYNMLLDGLERNGKSDLVDLYRKDKKHLQTASLSEHRISMEEMTCNLLFARDVVP